MPELFFNKRVNPRRLIGELAAIPGVVRTIESARPGFDRQSLVTVGTSGDDSSATIYADDSLPQSVIDQIKAAVAAHDGTPDPVPPTVDFGQDLPDNFPFLLAQAVQDLRAYLALTAAQSAQAINFVPALKTSIRVVLYLVRRQLG